MSLRHRGARGPPALVYANQHLETLADLRAQLREVQHALARDEALWARLKINDITPETDAERHAVGPRILTLRTEVARLLREEADTVQPLRTSTRRRRRMPR